MAQDYVPKRKEVSIDLSKPMPFFERFYNYKRSIEELLDHEEPIISKAARRSGMERRSLKDRFEYYKDKLYYHFYPLEKYDVYDKPTHLAAQHIHSMRLMRGISLTLALGGVALTYSSYPENSQAYPLTIGYTLLGLGFSSLFSWTIRRKHKDLCELPMG
ncbi:hypothetical protein HY212_00145 [Candidatus Pacearchaeota archaeon]|nr:hypothetical protein [Candidatus Pacearchaeota archaeon]